MVFYSNGCVIVDRILADLDYWNNLMEKLEHFYVKLRFFGEEFLWKSLEQPHRYKLLCITTLYCMHVCN